MRESTQGHPGKTSVVTMEGPLAFKNPAISDGVMLKTFFSGDGSRQSSRLPFVYASGVAFRQTYVALGVPTFTISVDVLKLAGQQISKKSCRFCMLTIVCEVLHPPVKACSRLLVMHRNDGINGALTP